MDRLKSAAEHRRERRVEAGVDSCYGPLGRRAGWQVWLFRSRAFRSLTSVQRTLRRATLGSRPLVRRQS